MNGRQSKEKGSWLCVRSSSRCINLEILIRVVEGGSTKLDYVHSCQDRVDKRDQEENAEENGNASKGSSPEETAVVLNHAVRSFQKFEVEERVYSAVYVRKKSNNGV